MPAGPHEVEVIELARIRRAWEHSVSSITGKGSFEKRKQIIDSLEREQWALREKVFIIFVYLKLIIIL